MTLLELGIYLCIKESSFTNVVRYYIKFCTILVINIINKISSVFDWCRTINPDKCDCHREFTRMCSDAAACMQTTQGCYDVLHITQYSGTNGSLKEAPGTTVHLVEEEEYIKLAQIRPTGIIGKFFTYKSHKPLAHIQGDYHSTRM
jgi:hypothetical protein